MHKRVQLFQFFFVRKDCDAKFFGVDFAVGNKFTSESIRNKFYCALLLIKFFCYLVAIYNEIAVPLQYGGNGAFSAAYAARYAYFNSVYIFSLISTSIKQNLFCFIQIFSAFYIYFHFSI